MFFVRARGSRDSVVTMTVNMKWMRCEQGEGSAVYPDKNDVVTRDSWIIFAKRIV